jgi:hypothetical protein
MWSIVQALRMRKTRDLRVDAMRDYETSILLMYRDLIVRAASSRILWLREDKNEKAWDLPCYLPVTSLMIPGVSSTSKAGIWLNSTWAVAVSSATFLRTDFSTLARVSFKVRLSDANLSS